MNNQRFKWDLPDKPEDHCGSVFASLGMAAMYKSSCRRKILQIRVPAIEGIEKTSLKELIDDVVRDIDIASWRTFSGVTASEVTSKLERDLKTGAFFVTLFFNHFRRLISESGYKTKQGYKQRRSVIASRGLYKRLHGELATLPFSEFVWRIRKDIRRRYYRDRGDGHCVTEINVGKDREKYLDVFEMTLACNRQNPRDSEEIYVSQDLISEISVHLANRVFEGKAYRKLRSIGRENLATQFERILHDLAVRGKQETIQQIVWAYLSLLNPTDITRLFKKHPSSLDGRRGEVWEVFDEVVRTNARFDEFYGASLPQQ